MKIKGLLFFFLICNAITKGIAFGKPLDKAPKGVIDLRNLSIQEKLPLNGKWIFCWEQLISPVGGDSDWNTSRFPEELECAQAQQ